jgi:hypothetical protein
MPSEAHRNTGMQLIPRAIIQEILISDAEFAIVALDGTSTHSL